jgi:hypothetical protein
MDAQTSKKIVKHLDLYKKGIELSDSGMEVRTIAEYKKFNMVYIILCNGHSLLLNLKVFKEAYKKREKHE